MSNTEVKPKKEKKDLMYWVKLALMVLPLVGGGTYFGTTQWDDDDDDGKYELQETDAESRPIQMEQDDTTIGKKQEIINNDESEDDK